MSAQKISALIELLGANQADDDLLVIVDKSDTTQSSSGSTKKIKVSELLADIEAILGNAPTSFYDSIASRLDALEQGLHQTNVNLLTHAGKTKNVHGITDSSLITYTGSPPPPPSFDYLPPGAGFAWYPTSVFNTKIADMSPVPTVRATSDDIIGGIFARGTTGNARFNEKAGGFDGGGGTSSNDYSHVVYTADSGDPLVTIHQTQNWGTPTVPQWGNPDIEGKQIRLPADAQQAGGGDGSIGVVQSDGTYANWEFDLWGVTSDPPYSTGDQLVGGFGYRNRVDQTGLWAPGPPAHGGITAAGFSLNLGVVRADEWTGDDGNGGVIEHALVAAVAGWNGRCYPGKLTGGTSGQIPQDGTVPPMGMLMRLRPAFDVTKGGSAPDWQQPILQAMKDYGIYICDFGSATMTLHLDSDTPYIALDQPSVHDYLNDTFSHSGAWSLDEGGTIDWASELQAMTVPPAP